MSDPAMPDQMTTACGNGKQMWTQSLAEVKWFSSKAAAADAAEAAKVVCKDMAWAKKAVWNLLDEAVVKEWLARKPVDKI